MERGLLKIHVVCGKNLWQSEEKTADTYCTVSLVDNQLAEIKKTKQKSKVAKKSSQPCWDAHFDFFVSSETYGILFRVKSKTTFAKVTIAKSLILSTRLLQPQFNEGTWFRLETPTEKPVFLLRESLSSTSAQVLISGSFTSESRSRRSSVIVLEKEKDENTRKLNKLFNVPPDQVVIDKFVCALDRTVVAQGVMYITQDYIYFYSITKVRVVIKMSSIASIEKKRTGIKVIMSDDEEVSFVNFLHQQKAFELLSSQLLNYERNKKEEEESIKMEEVNSEDLSVRELLLDELKKSSSENEPEMVTATTTITTASITPEELNQVVEEAAKEDEKLLLSTIKQEQLQGALKKHNEKVEKKQKQKEQEDKEIKEMQIKKQDSLRQIDIAKVTQNAVQDLSRIQVEKLTVQDCAYFVAGILPLLFVLPGFYRESLWIVLVWPFVVAGSILGADPSYSSIQFYHYLIENPRLEKIKQLDKENVQWAIFFVLCWILAIFVENICPSIFGYRTNIFGQLVFAATIGLYTKIIVNYSMSK